MINLFDSSTHTELDNGEFKNFTINRLTVFFDDGRAIIEEIHEPKKNNISREELEYKAFSVRLPDRLVKSDIVQIADVLKPLIDANQWACVRDVMYLLPDHVNFYDHEKVEKNDIDSFGDLTGNVKKFAIACYETNSIDELKEGLSKNNNACLIDCKAWGITRKQYFKAVAAALVEKLSDK